MHRRRLGAGIIASLMWLALSAIPTVSTSQSPYEPNDAPTLAAGPLLAGQTYAASLETASDNDFFVFYVAAAAGAQVGLTVENLGGGEAKTMQIDAKVSDSTGRHVGGNLLYVIKGERRSATVTLPSGKYFVEVTANEVDEGQRASYTLSPGGSDGAFAPYDAIASRCASATRSVRVREVRLERSKTRLQRATGRVRRARYGSGEARNTARALHTRAKAQVKRRKDALKAAIRAQSPWCYIPQ